MTWPFGRTPQFLHRFLRLLGTRQGFLPLTSFLSCGKALSSSRRFMAIWGARSQIKHISSAFYFWNQALTVFCWVGMAALMLRKPEKAGRQILIPLQPVTPGSQWGTGLAGDRSRCLALPFTTCVTRLTRIGQSIP